MRDRAWASGSNKVHGGLWGYKARIHPREKVLGGRGRRTRGWKDECDQNML